MLLSKTVVGLFRDRSEVDGVLANLKSAGIPKDSTKVVDQGELASHERLVGEEASRKEGILGVLKHLFGTHSYTEFEHSDLHRDWVRKGGLLVAVNTNEAEAKRVTEIMKGSFGDMEAATHMGKADAELGSEKLAAEPVTSANLPRAVTTEPAAAIRPNKAEEETIPIIQEELHVGKRTVRGPSVRVIKHVSEMPVEETINLHDETITVDRHPVQRIANETDIRAFGDSQVEMTESKEEAVISKEAHVVEEITISKNVVDHEEKIRDKVRKTDIDIEGLGPEKLKQMGFRKDFDARFGKTGRSYSDYVPAYEFGSTLGSDVRYRNRDWASIELDTRRAWEAKGNSWREYSEAIRHGFESTRGRRAA